jgi:hypothetical protein
MTDINNRVSLNISDQGREGTCFAHTLARIITNVIRQTIPSVFYPLVEDQCNDIYDVSVMNMAFSNVKHCSNNTANNLLLYTYVYKTIVREYGCDGANTAIVLRWFTQFIKLDFGSVKHITDVLGELPDFDVQRLHDICQKFTSEFYTKQGNDMIFEEIIVNNSSDRKPKPIFVDLIDFVLSNGYYIAITNGRHVVTIVGTKQWMGNKLLVIKHSAGKKDFYTREIGPAIKGISGISLDKLVNVGYNKIMFIIPNILTKEEHAKRNKQLVFNELVDIDRRTKRTHPYLNFITRIKKRMTSKSKSKSKSNSKTKSNRKKQVS